MYYLPWNNIILAGTTEDTVKEIVTHSIPKVGKVDEILLNFKETFPD